MQPGRVAYLLLEHQDQDHPGLIADSVYGSIC